MQKPFLLILPVWLLVASVSPLRALEVDSHFSDHMILQRGMAVSVWGTAAPNSDVTVTFADQTVPGAADASGKWRVLLPSLQASAESRVMTVAGDGKEIAIADVLVGDVWVGSGQSNMAGKVASYAKRDETLAKLVEKAPYPNIRLMNGGAKPVWKLASTDNVNGFSAILFAFGERLHSDLDVPIGLIVGAVGGTPSGSWIPAEVYESSEKAKAEVAKFAKTWDSEKAKTQFEAKVAQWEKQAAEATAAGEKPKGRKPNPPVEPGGASRGKIGGLFDNFIRTSVGYGIRGVLWDQGESGTGIMGLDQHTCMSELIRGWRELWNQGDFPFLFVQKPSGLGNAFSNDNPITREANPFKPLPEKGPVGNGSERYLYTRLMLDNENSWMVPAIDLGPSVHPLNKWGYGNRAAEVALQMVYQAEGIQAYGPIYDSHSIEGSKVSVKFTQIGKGLVVQHSDALQGFTLAGEDGVWHWATATISGNDTVTVSSDAVPSPKHVRFAYAQDRTWANLFNKEGLPALAFSN